MGTARRLLLVAGLALAAGSAAAQTNLLPWPGDTPQSGATAPWPGEAAPAVSAPPAAVGLTPGMAPPRPMDGMGGGGMGGGMGGGAPPPCLAEFSKLREDVEKRGMAAKTAGQRKASREDMCKFISSYADAEAKWVKYSDTNAQSCGIPPQIVSQLKQVHTNTEQTRQKVCAAGPSSAPTLSDALLSSASTPRAADAKKKAGALDTLTGTIGTIAR